jgi:Ca-activated chloride channel family protein
MSRKSLSAAISIASLLAAAAAAAQDGDIGPPPDIDATYASFADAHHGDMDSCFGADPRLEGAAREAEFEGPGAATPVRPKRLMMAIDASGSMAGKSGGRPKMEAAKGAARNFLAALPDDVEVGLIAFGHEGTNQESGKAQSCAAVETIQPLGATDEDALRAALDRFEATGWTPLAAALEMAGASFGESDIEGEQVVYVVSDGEETCGGDPAAAARALRESRVKAVVNIIGFDLAEKDRAQLMDVAEAGGGVFTEARDADELSAKVKEMGRRMRNTSEMGGRALDINTRRGGNTLRSVLAASRVSVCVQKLTSRESQAFNKTFSARYPHRELKKQMWKRLKERHAAYRERADAFKDRIMKARGERDAELERQMERAREGYERAR